MAWFSPLPCQPAPGTHVRAEGIPRPRLGRTGQHSPGARNLPSPALPFHCAAAGRCLMLWETSLTISVRTGALSPTNTAPVWPASPPKSQLRRDKPQNPRD